MDHTSTNVSGSERSSDAHAHAHMSQARQAFRASSWGHALQAMDFQVIIPRLLCGPLPIVATVLLLAVALVLQ